MHDALNLTIHKWTICIMYGPVGPSTLPSLLLLGQTWAPLILDVQQQAVFSFLYFLKIKISKIYVCFEIFQKYPPVARP